MFFPFKYHCQVQFSFFTFYAWNRFSAQLYPSSKEMRDLIVYIGESAYSFIRGLSKSLLQDQIEMQSP